MIKLILVLAAIFSNVVLIKGQDPVKVTTYYESLCPDSIRFFKNQLQPTYETLNASGIMYAETFAYGKANSYERADGTGYLFTCQHGQEECYGNKMLECAKKYAPNHEVFLQYDFCAMAASDPPNSGSVCSAQLGMDYGPIQTCTESEEGEQILNAVGIQEDALDPTLYYVPWIFINDVFSQENLDAAQDDLLGLVCSTYTGTPPPECSAK